MNLLASLFSVLLCLLPVDHVVSSKVLEVSDKFLTVAKDGLWLVKFYAPWCGHCKKLEPVWKHVAQSLADTHVRVARVDCTRFSRVGQEYNIRGYPTILFLDGDNVYSYEGDRTREDIVAFARRLMGPPVKAITSDQDLSEAKLNSLFFLYVGPLEDPLYNEFLLNAKHFHQDEHMYSASDRMMTRHIGHSSGPGPAVFVFKDGQYHQFNVEDYVVERSPRDADDDDNAAAPTPATTVANTSIYSWVMKERFPMFAKVTRGRFGKVMATNKLIVLAVLEENKLEQVSQDMELFKEMVRGVVTKHHDKYRDRFQFGWTGSPDLANSVAMDTLALPNLIVINSTTYQHHLPEDPPEYLTPEAIVLFLDSVLEGEAPSYGGSSWLVRLYRAWYEAKTSLYDMWRGNPVLTSVLLGLPLGFLSLIFYSICCADIMDAEEEEELEEEEDYHEKAE